MITSDEFPESNEQEVSQAEDGSTVLRLEGLPPAQVQFTATSGVQVRKVWAAEQPMVAPVELKE